MKMKPLKASDLIELLQGHIELYGDENVYIFDSYDMSYKTFSERKISRLHNNFVIECECESED
jgi:hypothetical protein